MSKQLCVTVHTEYRSQQNYAPSFPSSRNNVAIKRNSDALPKYRKATDTSVTNLLNASSTNLLNTPASANIQSVIAELEKRRAKFFAQACAAEARAQEAEEKRVLAQNRLEQEMNQRLAAEQRLREFEEDRLRQLQAAEARLKKAESRIKEAENDATSLTIALAKAYQKKAEAEATARAVEEKAHIIQTLFLESEGANRVAIEGNLIFGLMVFASRSKIWAMERAIRNVEAKHRPQEDYLKNLLEKQTARLRSKDEKTPFAEGGFRSRNLLKSVDDDLACRVTEQKGLGIKLKLTLYAMVITTLVGACWGFISALLQN